MCSPAVCHQCRKVTYSGCGMHVAQVMASVPAGSAAPAVKSVRSTRPPPTITTTDQEDDHDDDHDRSRTGCRRAPR